MSDGRRRPDSALDPQARLPVPAAGARSALVLNALVDGLDAVVSSLEIRDRGRLDTLGAGGVALNIAGLACWATAALALRR